jgi:tetratricopeptide (TPR) repeat protein
MMAMLRRGLVLALGAVAIVLFTMAFRVKRTNETRVVYATLGELQAIHPDVRVAGKEVRGVQRFGRADRLTTGPDGRARARLDDGTSLVLDRATDLVTTDRGVTLERGRVFVQGAVGARTEVVAGDLTVLVGASTVAVDRTDAARFYCVSGEAIARAFGKEVRVHSGEMARAAGAELTVGPEKVWNDWTGGMARPWSAAGKPRGAIGELWGRRSDATEDVGTPLATRSHEVDVTIRGEVATTETRTTYFNAGSSIVTGDFRMALPEGAIVSGFAVGTGDALEAAEVRLAIDGPTDPSIARLEWAGEGWVRGTTRAIRPAETAVVLVRYVEWLSPAGGRMTYRYPMLGEGTPPVIGEFHARIQADVDATAIGIGPDMQMDGDTIEMRRADFRPTADLVVDMQLRPGAFDRARAYFVPGPDDTASSFLLVRTEAAPATSTRGTTLALLLDTSRSIDASALDAERAVVEGLLEGLGPEDKVVVFAGDDHAAPVGPESLGPVDDARRAAIQKGLGELRPGGATDLGVTLERVADALPADDASAMVLYLGDGWPTLGDLDVDAIRARLSRRHGGMPRLGAVAVGPMANRFGLTALVREGGPVFEARDRAGAAEVAVHLLAKALEPSVAGVAVDLGPDVERVYPRGARAVRTGDTLTTVGRLKGQPPRAIDLVYRDAGAEKKEHRTLSVLPVVDAGDLRRRWGSARVEELMLRGGGRESVVDAALQNQLLTPWTGWAVGVSSDASFHATPLWSRVLDSELDGNLAVFSASFATPRPRSGALRPPNDPPWPRPSSPGDKDAWKLAAEASARRTLEESLGAAAKCRESRAALRPEVGGVLHVELSLAGDGSVRSVSVKGGTAFDDDLAVDRCVEQVIRSSTFFVADGGSALFVTYELHLPPASDARARACSPTASLPAPMRRGVWFERLHRPESPTNPLGMHGERAYFRAKAACEAPTWTDRRTFLELLLASAGNGYTRVELARMLAEGGDADAAELVRREAVRRAESPAELDTIRRALLANEPDVVLPFVTAYAKATTNGGRLVVVRTFLRLAPHDSRLRRRELALLEALDRRDDLVAAAQAIRQEPFLDAALLADAASALRRIGAKDEARRTFGELAERAPEVPFARAFLGDRLLDEGLFDEATTAYDALLRRVPDDPAASFRLALANAGAGRLDLASRMLAHVTETGGRTSDPALEELAGIESAMLVAEARAGKVSPDEASRLARLARGTELPDAAGLVLVRAPTWVPGLDVVVVRGKSGDDAEPLQVVRAPSLGLAGLRLERGEGALRLRVSRQLDLEPSRPATASIEVLVTGGQGDHPRWVKKDVPLRADGKETEIVWDGATLL